MLMMAAESLASSEIISILGGMIILLTFCNKVAASLTVEFMKFHSKASCS